MVVEMLMREELVSWRIEEIEISENVSFSPTESLSENVRYDTKS